MIRFSDTMIHEDPVLDDGTNWGYDQNNSSPATLDVSAIFNEEPETNLDDLDEDTENEIRSFPGFEEKVSDVVQDDSNA